MSEVISLSDICGSESVETLNCKPHNFPRFTEVSLNASVEILDFFASDSIFSRASPCIDFDKTMSFDFEIVFKTSLVPRTHLFS